MVAAAGYLPAAPTPPQGTRPTQQTATQLADYSPRPAFHLESDLFAQRLQLTLSCQLSIHWVSAAIMTTTRVLMVYPKFNPNWFWNIQPVCDIAGARCVEPPLGLITVAALLPVDWQIRLVDRNAEKLRECDLDWADLVMTGGMIPQQPDTLELIDICHRRGKPVVIGGPAVTSTPEAFDHADFLVLGEAEGVIDQFIDAWTSGTKRGVFDARVMQVDVTRSPVPRFDLLKPAFYLCLAVQFSRGCPFNCEFCDIIELYGRLPRTKTNQQMLAEVDAIHRMGYRGHVDFVDDNLIGNKKAVKKFLPDLREWQERHGYPFKFSTEASINLSDDPVLLGLMRDTKFFTVFVGIETPDTETLVTLQKKQNTRRSIADSIHRIYSAGIFVTAGFIIGFDTEREGVADSMVKCIEESSIPVCLLGLLAALPNTQLTRRLQREGRLLYLYADKVDQITGVLNFITLRPRHEILADFKSVVERIYAPTAYFARVRALGRALKAQHQPIARPLKCLSRDLKTFGRLAWQMNVRKPHLCRHFWGTLIDCARHNIDAMEGVLWMMIVYLHLANFADFVTREVNSQLETARQDALQQKPLAMTAV